MTKINIMVLLIHNFNYSHYAMTHLAVRSYMFTAWPHDRRDRRVDLKSQEWRPVVCCRIFSRWDATNPKQTCQEVHYCNGRHRHVTHSQSSAALFHNVYLQWTFNTSYNQRQHETVTRRNYALAGIKTDRFNSLAGFLVMLCLYVCRTLFG
jgi:hypothetical protein